MLSKHAASSRKQRGILDSAACSDHARQNFLCWIRDLEDPGFQEIELLIDGSADFQNSAASRLNFSVTLIRTSCAEQTCSQQPKTGWNPRFSCMFRSCSAKFWLLGLADTRAPRCFVITKILTIPRPQGDIRKSKHCTPLGLMGMRFRKLQEGFPVPVHAFPPNCLRSV